MSIPYRFMPWARRGLARAHQNADGAGAALATRPRVSVGLTIQAKRDGNAVTAVSGNIDLSLYGPGDVIGIDPRLIVRTDPKPNITNFEPNYLPIVDFDPPDFPWLLTPAKANANDTLRPWLVLVVVDRSVVKPPALKAGRPLPALTLTAYSRPAQSRRCISSPSQHATRRRFAIRACRLSVTGSSRTAMSTSPAPRPA